MPNYRSLIGGYFSANPTDKSSGPVTIRMNNPGAINGASWESSYPGYVGTVETTPGNRSTIFEAPEYGVGAWWDLLRRYRANNASTVGEIINRYGGGQDYSAYLQFVLKVTGFTPDTPIDLNNDQQLLQLGHAMFRYEAGRALPWNDDQLLYGVRCGREFMRTRSWPSSAPIATPPPGPVADGQITNSDLLPVLQKLLLALTGRATGAGITSTTADTTTAPLVLSPIDKMFGGEALVGYKTILGVIGYVIVAVLQATGVLGVATPAGQILSVLTIAFSVLGALAKVDRMTQTIGTAATKSG